MLENLQTKITISNSKNQPINQNLVLNTK